MRVMVAVDVTKRVDVTVVMWVDIDGMILVDIVVAV